MSKVYFVRHAHPENPLKQVGHDGVVSEEGKKQLEELVDFFATKSLLKIFHSPLRRAQETAVAVANGKLDLLEADGRLRERQWGKNDSTWEEVFAVLNRMSLMERYGYKPENGESWEEFERRTAEFWNEKVSNTTEDVAIVSHEGTMRCLIAYLLRDQLGGLMESLQWSIEQNFPLASVSLYDKDTKAFEKDIFIPKLDTS